MPQRTIADAEAALDALAGISDHDRRSYAQEITDAKQQAVQAAGEIVTGRVNEVAGFRDDALAELCAVRDAYAELTRQAELGHITATECDRALNKLRSRQRTAENRITQTEQALVFVEAVEADPVAYGDGLLAKYPLTRPDFTF